MTMKKKYSMIYKMWFLRADIKKINENCYTLRLYNTWYMFWQVQEFFVFTTLEEAKAKLLEIRCKGNLTVEDE